MPIQTKPGELGMATPFGELLGSSTDEMNAELDDYVALGVEKLRIDFNWDQIETRPGVFDWTVVDGVVNAAATRGIEVVAILNRGSPSWVGGDLASAADHQAFGAFAAEAASHFDGRVDLWEILNEPNLHGISPESYTGLLKSAYSAIKSVDPDSTVITAGNASVPETGDGLYGAVDYLQRMYEAGAQGHFDAVGHHPYTYPYLPSEDAEWSGWQMMEDGIRGAMVANGDQGKQVWVTELGAPTTGGGAAMTEAEQSQVLREAVDLAQGTDWVGPILWYSYRDRGGDTGDTENWFGLVGPDGEQKPVYETYRQLALSDDDAPAPSGETFAFETAPDGALIEDFSQGDTIDLSAIDASTAEGAQSFTFVGGAWLSKAGDLGVYVDEANDLTYIQADLDGDGAFDMNLIHEGSHAFTAADFAL